MLLVKTNLNVKKNQRSNMNNVPNNTFDNIPIIDDTEKSHYFEHKL